MNDEELLEAFNLGMHRDHESLTPDRVRISGLRAIASAAWNEGNFANGSWNAAHPSVNPYPQTTSTSTGDPE